MVRSTKAVPSLEVRRQEKAQAVGQPTRVHADLYEALQAMVDSACRPGDDGKYDDQFDAARKFARELLTKAVDSGQNVNGTLTDAKAIAGQPIDDTQTTN